MSIIRTKNFKIVFCTLALSSIGYSQSSSVSVDFQSEIKTSSDQQGETVTVNRKLSKWSYDEHGRGNDHPLGNSSTTINKYSTGGASLNHQVKINGKEVDSTVKVSSTPTSSTDSKYTVTRSRQTISPSGYSSVKKLPTTTITGPQPTNQQKLNNVNKTSGDYYSSGSFTAYQNQDGSTKVNATTGGQKYSSGRNETTDADGNRTAKYSPREYVPAPQWIKQLNQTNTSLTKTPTGKTLKVNNKTYDIQQDGNPPKK